MTAAPRTAQRTLRDYRVLGSLGAGPSGEVLRAHDPVRRAEVALKVFRPHLCTPDGLSRYAEAAATAADAPGTAAGRLLELVPAEPRPFAVLELVAGQSLGELVHHRGPLAWTEARPLFARCAVALAAAHRVDVVHAALKPSNLRVLPGMLPRVLDYGVAALRQQHAAEATRAHETHGLEYQSPEQLRGEPPLPESDLYALGVVMFEALTGQLPFQGRPQEIAYHHLRTAPPSPRLLMPALTRDVEALVLGLLAKAPAARAGAAAALRALAAAPHPGDDDEFQTTTWVRQPTPATPASRARREPARVDETIETAPAPAETTRGSRARAEATAPSHAATPRGPRPRAEATEIVRTSRAGATRETSRDDASTDASVTTGPLRRAPPPPEAHDETVVLAMPTAPAGHGGAATVVLGHMQGKEFLVDDGPPREPTSVHTHTSATVFVARAPVAPPPPPDPGGPAWRRRWRGPWTLERKLVAVNVAFGALILFALLILNLR